MNEGTAPSHGQSDDSSYGKQTDETMKAPKDNQAVIKRLFSIRFFKILRFSFALFLSDLFVLIGVLQITALQPLIFLY